MCTPKEAIMCILKWIHSVHVQHNSSNQDEGCGPIYFWACFSGGIHHSSSLSWWFIVAKIITHIYCNVLLGPLLFTGKYFLFTPSSVVEPSSSFTSFRYHLKPIPMHCIVGSEELLFIYEKTVKDISTIPYYDLISCKTSEFPSECL